MSILQKFGFRDSPYERPQDKWVCGRLAEGKPCARGPDARGRCRVTTVCQPHLEGERWQCRRSPVEGGPCEDGPLPDGRCCMAIEPCVPKASLRTLRKRTAIWAVSLSIGLVALILGGGQAKQLMPGPLSAPHASQADCLTCHAGAAAADLGWLHQLVADIGPEDNAKLCLGCHDVGNNPFTAHTQPVEELRRLTALYDAGERVAKQDSLVHRIALQVPGKNPQSGQATIYCATCHEEHKGPEYDQTAIDNQRCQTCHASQFGTFAASHPEFSSYPFSRRTRIVFNHKSHFGKHFPKTREETTENRTVPSVCADCHEPGVQQRYMEIRPYEDMCASCHDGEITGVTRASGPKGISFISVPGLDVATLNERGLDAEPLRTRYEGEDYVEPGEGDAYDESGEAEDHEEPGEAESHDKPGDTTESE